MNNNKEKEEKEESEEKIQLDKAAVIDTLAGMFDTFLHLAIAFKIGSFCSSWVIGIAALLVLELLHLAITIFAACDFSDPAPLAMQAYEQISSKDSSFTKKLLSFILGFDLTILAFTELLASHFSCAL